MEVQLSMMFMISRFGNDFCVVVFFKTQSNNIYYIDIARVYRMAITSYSTHLFTT